MPREVDVRQVPRRLVQPEGLEDVVPAVVAEQLSRNLLHEITDEAEGYVVVIPAIAWWPGLEILRRVVEPSARLQVSFDPLRQGDLRVATLVAPAVPLSVPDGGLVRQEKSERYRHLGMRWISDREGHVVTDVIIQLETPLFPELHQRSGGERLRYGADVLDPVQVHRDLPFQVSEAVGIGPGHPVVLDDASGHAGDRIGGHPLPDERVDFWG